MNFKKQFSQILLALGFTEKAKKKELTQQDWEKIAQNWKETFNTDFYQELNSGQQQEQTRIAADHQRALEIISSADTDDSASEDGGSSDGAATDGSATSGGAAATGGAPGQPAGAPSLADRVAQFVDRVQKVERQNSELRSAMTIMAGTATPDNVPVAHARIASLNGPGHTNKYAFGIEHEMFSMNLRWNKIAANPDYATLSRVNEETDGKAFRESLKKFSEGVASRYEDLFRSGKLAALATSTTIDYSGLETAGLGNQYVIMRTDAIIARLKKVKDVFNIFPRRYGVQDRELITNAYIGEVSQGYQTGRVFKGDFDLKPELAYVDDAMIKLSFESMEWLERTYLGYLNTEGSEQMKYNMIEWCYVWMIEKAIREQSQRKIRGFYIKPAAGTPGQAMHASTGVLYTLIRYFHENKLLPIADVDYTSTEGVMLSAVKEFISSIKEKVEDIDGMVLHLNANHKDWLARDIRAAYGLQTDFSGIDTSRVPDTDTQIVWVPNMGQYTFMILQEPGNIQSIENKPGEMLALRMFEEFEEVMFRSRWKEGTAAAYVGKPFATLAALVANDYQLQEVFINKPVVEVAADATTLAHSNATPWFVTPANAEASPVITDITGAKKGVVYIIENGSATYPSKIAKSGKFSEITEAYTPTAVGDYIMVALNDAGTKFLDLERCVGGTRSINTALQPNIPGAR